MSILPKKVNRKQSKNPFEEVQDIVGLRIVCLFLSDIGRIGEIIRRSFKIILEDNKIDEGDASSFGYLSVHFIVKLSDECKGPRYDKLGGFQFEIQIRTLAMDAWANISHYLDYKTETDVPKELKRDFYALSGLFYVADKHFEMFFKSREKLTQSLEEVGPALDQEINLDTLTAYLRKEFADRRHVEPKYISELVDELLKNGYKNIEDLDHAVKSNMSEFLVFEEENPPSDDNGIKNENNKFYDTGTIRIILEEIIPTKQSNKSIM